MAHDMLILQGVVVFLVFVIFRHFFLFPPFVWLVDLIDCFIFEIEHFLVKIFVSHEELEESQKKAISVFDIKEYNKHQNFHPQNTKTGVGKLKDFYEHQKSEIGLE